MTTAQQLTALKVTVGMLVAGITTVGFFLLVANFHRLTDLQRCAILATFAGLVGGFFNALMAYQGFALPRSLRKTVTLDGNEGKYTAVISIFTPGFLGNMLVGVAGALVYFGLETQLTSQVAVGARGPTAGAAASLTVGQLVLIGLAGYAGSRIMSDAVDKRLLKQTAAEVATTPASPEKSTVVAVSSNPARAWGDSGVGNPNWRSDF